MHPEIKSANRVFLVCGGLSFNGVELHVVRKKLKQKEYFLKFKGSLNFLDIKRKDLDFVLQVCYLIFLTQFSLHTLNYIRNMDVMLNYQGSLLFVKENDCLYSMKFLQSYADFVQHNFILSVLVRLLVLVFVAALFNAKFFLVVMLQASNTAGRA